MGFVDFLSRAMHKGRNRGAQGEGFSNFIHICDILIVLIYIDIVTCGILIRSHQFLRFHCLGMFGDMLDSRYDCVQRLKRRQRGLELRLRIEAEPSCAITGTSCNLCQPRGTTCFRSHSIS